HARETLSATGSIDWKTAHAACLGSCRPLLLLTALGGFASRQPDELGLGHMALLQEPARTPLQVRWDGYGKVRAQPGDMLIRSDVRRHAFAGQKAEQSLRRGAVGVSRDVDPATVRHGQGSAARQGRNTTRNRAVQPMAGVQRDQRRPIRRNGNQLDRVGLLVALELLQRVSGATHPQARGPCRKRGLIKMSRETPDQCEISLQPRIIRPLPQRAVKGALDEPAVALERMPGEKDLGDLHSLERYRWL